MGRFLDFLRTAALIGVLAGAAGSLVFMLRAGYRNRSGLLVTLFTIWVLAPFAGLAWGWLVSQRWEVRTRTALYCVTLAVTLGSLGIYAADAWGPPKPKAAFVFVAVPPVSWLVMAIALALAAFLFRRRPE
ncbi:MAG: hypothetical protein M3O35_05810 [Acidobacteriota bacterium]|nr:hypothetical protein [Acidobacteriota bacterium]